MIERALGIAKWIVMYATMLETPVRQTVEGNEKPLRKSEEKHQAMKLGTSSLSHQVSKENFLTLVNMTN